MPAFITRVLMDDQDDLKGKALPMSAQDAINAYWRGFPLPDGELIVRDADGKIFRAVVSAEFEQLTEGEARDHLESAGLDEHEIAEALATEAR